LAGFYRHGYAEQRGRNHEKRRRRVHAGRKTHSDLPVSAASSNGRSARLPQLARYADALAIATVVALPVSMTLTSILIVLWVIALVPTLTWAEVRGEIATAAGGLPLLFFALGLLGMVWTQASWPERLGGFDAFIKFLLLPLFIVQFRRSDRGVWIMVGYLASCTVLLAASWILIAWPGGAFAATGQFGVPIGSAGMQCAEFAICAVVLLFVAIEMFRRGRRCLGSAALALVVGFLGNILYVAAIELPAFPIAFMPLVVVPLLITMLFLKKFKARTMIGLIAAAAAAGAVLWISLDTATYRVLFDKEKVWADRLMYWQRSVTFIDEAPVLGHGTGSMPRLFARAAAGHTGLLAGVTNHPFQQTLAVGIQLGLVGVTVLWAMWIAHLLLFRGDTLPEWVGFVIVSQSIFACMVDSQLFGWFGWTYVIGVGVAAGMVRQLRAERQALEQMA
jgi:O-antigen ligase